MQRNAGTIRQCNTASNHTRNAFGLLAAATIIAAGACSSNSTAPQATTVQIAGPDSIAATGYKVADDTVDRVGCIDLLQLGFDNAPDSAVLDSGVVQYTGLDNSALGVIHLSADTLAVLEVRSPLHRGRL